MIRLVATVGGSLLLVACFFLAVFLTVLYFVQEKLLFVPSTLPETYTFDFHRKFEERVFDFVLKPGGRPIRIDSLYFPGPSAKAPLILYFHGNTGHLTTWGEVAGELAEKTGAGVWILDYPGYGKSGGDIVSETQLENLAESFYEMGVRQASGEHRRVILYGRSIGTGLATYLAFSHNSDAALAGVVLETPFYNMLAMVRRTVFFVPAFLLKYHFPTNDRLKHVTKPVLIFHGTADETVPFEHGETLVKRSLPSAKFVKIEGGKHNDLETSPLYWRAVEEFVEEFDEEFDVEAGADAGKGTSSNAPTSQAK